MICKFVPGYYSDFRSTKARHLRRREAQTWLQICPAAVRWLRGLSCASSLGPSQALGPIPPHSPEQRKQTADMKEEPGVEERINWAFFHESEG